MKRFRVPVMMVLLLLVLVMGMPVLAQAQPAEPLPDAIILPQWALVVMGIFAGGLLLGLLFLLNKVIEALKTSYPPGTVDTVTKALGDGLQQVLDQLEANAPNTPTNIDDFLLPFIEPLTEAIIARLRGEGIQVAPPDAQGVVHPPAESG